MHSRGLTEIKRKKLNIIILYLLKSSHYAELEVFLLLAVDDDFFLGDFLSFLPEARLPLIPSSIVGFPERLRPMAAKPKAMKKLCVASLICSFIQA